MWDRFTYSNVFSFGKSQKKLDFEENYHRYIMLVIILSTTTPLAILAGTLTDF
jgi:hypothetical protein